MKQILFVLLLLFSNQCLSQIINPHLDTALVTRLGADDYGMKKYILVILKSGENKTTDKNFTDSCFLGHLANIGRLADLRKLIVAGPFGKNNDDFRGLFIMNVTTIAEADALLETDPAIREKLLKAEYYPWYGSAALPEYLEASERIWKFKP